MPPHLQLREKLEHSKNTRLDHIKKKIMPNCSYLSIEPLEEKEINEVRYRFWKHNDNKNKHEERNISINRYVREVGGDANASRVKISTQNSTKAATGREARQPLTMEGIKCPHLRPCIANAVDTLPPTSAHKFIQNAFQSQITRHSHHPSIKFKQDEQTDIKQQRQSKSLPFHCQGSEGYKEEECKVRRKLIEII